jgi:hypothetical protein
MSLSAGRGRAAGDDDPQAQVGRVSPVFAQGEPENRPTAPRIAVVITAGIAAACEIRSGYSAPEPPLPADFGVRLIGANVDAHIARARSELAAWASANSDLVVPIVRAAQSLKTLNRQGEATCW